MKRKTFTFLGMAFLGLCLSFQLTAQTNVNMPYNTGVQQTFSISPPGTCSYNFYDNNGPGANYSSNSNPNTSIVTFAPSNAATHRVQVTFSTFATENSFDALYVYNGPTTGDPLISSGVGPIGFPFGGWMGGTAPTNTGIPGVVRGTGPSGALTFAFASDFIVTAAGWQAVVNQLPLAPCTVTAPPDMVASTGPDNCEADLMAPAPSFSPGGCEAANQIQYVVDGGMPVVVPQPLPANIVVAGLTSGNHMIEWQVVDPCGGALVSSDVQLITVEDQVPPVITCPADINLTLTPGACDAIINYNIGVTDNCPFFVPGPDTQFPASFVNHGSGQAFTLQGNLAPMGMYWNLTNNGLDPLSVTGFGVRFPNPLFGVVNPPRDVRIWSAPTYVGNETNPGAWTQVADVTVTSIPPYFATGTGDLAQVPLDMPVLIPPGETRGFHMYTPTNGLVFNFNFGVLPPLNNGPWTLTGGPTSFNELGGIFLPGTNCYPNIQVNSAIVGDPTPIQTAGLPSGSVFELGTTTNCFEVADVVGNTSSCCFDITINEYPNPSTSLACNDLVQISVDNNCEAYVSTDDILEGGPYGCYDNYLVAVEGFGEGFGGVIINNDAVGETLRVTVTDTATGNSCWGEIVVEDKIPPTIECRDVILQCTDPLPIEPAPALSGPQTILYSGLNDPLDNPPGQNLDVEYVFDYNYIPVGTPTQDVNVQIDLTHTWTMDVQVVVTAPDGESVTAFQVGGCAGQFPIDVIFDDEGQTGLTSCFDLDQDGARIQGFQLPGVQGPYLAMLDGVNAGGDWSVNIIDNFPVADAGTIFQVGLEVTVDLPAVPPADNCGEVEVTFVDEEFDGDCEESFKIIERTWTVTDASGLTASCVQTIIIEPIELDSIICPPTYEGECGLDPDPSVTGYPTTTEGDQVLEGGLCNIFVGYWDKELVDCGGGTKILRTWSILDWCTQESFECTQTIKLSDNEGPVIECPDDLTVSADPWFCEADVVVPQPSVYDECGTPFSLSLDAGELQDHLSGFAPFYVLNDVPVGTWELIWIATDDCGNESQCSFFITVEDDIPPVASCDEHTVVSIIEDHLYERGLTKIPATVLDDGSYDNCGPVTFLARRMDSCIDFDWTTDGAGIDEIPNGIVNSRDRGTVHRPLIPFACCDVATTVMVELQVTDQYGNVNFCMVDVEIQDKLAPFIMCPPDIQVSCAYWFPLEETAGFIPQEEDPLTPIFGKILDAYDYELSDRDSIIIDDPANTTVPQPYFWGLDGWADDNCDVVIDVRVRLFDECKGETLPPGAPTNAVQAIERTFRATDGQGNSSTCRQFIWIVDFIPFYISDQTCNNPDPNDGVIWPCDRNFTTCPDEIPVDYPTVFDDKCSIIGITYDDQVFYFVDNACYKIIRTWSVIDWCQYNSATGQGVWSYIQVIKVVDNIAPEFQDCPDEPVVLCVEDEGITLPANNQVFLGEADPNSTSCSVHVRIEHEVMEFCSDEVIYDVKVYPNNGSEFIQVNAKGPAPVDSNNIAIVALDTKASGITAIRNNGLPYNDRWCSNYPFPGGQKDYHRVLFTVEDGCGNISTCEYLFRLEDCKKPTPVCINGLSSVVMPSSGEVTIWAKDFDASSFDDCTANEDLKFSFSGNADNPSAKFACDCSLTTPDYPGQPCYDLATNGGPSFLVEIWVADEGTDDNCNAQISWAERNKDFCTTFIIIDDNEAVCDSTAPISGSILTEDIEPVESVLVNLESTSGGIMMSYMTSDNGAYHFLNPTIDWMISPHRTDNPKNGVSTLDLVRIQKHLLGIQKFDSPYKLIAADANNSQSVSAVDLVELRKLILGIYTELPNNESWRFVDSKFSFADPDKPWPFNEEIQYNGSQNSGLDFMGIKVGDVNGTAVANATQVEIRNAKGVVSFVTDDQMVKAGEEITVALTADKVESLLGFQFTLQTNGLQFAGVEGGVADMSSDNVAVFGDAITASWNKADGISTANDEILFTMTFTATQSGLLSEMLSISSRYTEAEAYDAQEEIFDLALEFRSGTGTAKNFALYQNEPNPFANETVINFDLPESMEATLTIYDVTGKVLKVIEGDYAAGSNSVTLKTQGLATSGVLYYTLNAAEFTATKKMVVLK